MAAPYQSQLGPGTETAYSGADAEDAGAAAGRGLEQAGDTIDRAIHQLKERNRDMEAADAGVKLAQASSTIDAYATDARTKAAPGAAGHTEGVVSQLDDMTANNLSGIKDPHIRAAFAQRYAEMRDRVGSQEYGWEASKRVEKLVTDVKTQADEYAKAQASNPNSASFVQSLHDVQTTIGALSVDDDTKTKLVKERQGDIALAFGRGLVDKDPDALIKMLDKGTLNPYLARAEDITELRSAADVEIRRREAALRQQRNLDEASVRQNGAYLLDRLSKGDTTVKPEEIDTALEGAKKYDLKELGFNLSAGKDKLGVIGATRDFTPPQWHEEIDKYAARAAGKGATSADAIHLANLRELAGPAIERFNANPAAAAANAGNPEPPVDWGNPDPKAVAARVNWAKAFRDSAHLDATPYLDVDEIKQLRDQVRNGGASGQLTVAANLRNTFGTNIATEIARQVDPSDKSIQLYVGLEPQAANLVARGTEALKRNPKLFAGGDGDPVRAQTIFNEYAAGIPAEFRDPVYNAARSITAAAGDAVHRDSLEGDEFEATFRNAIQRAAGQIGEGNGRTGGFAVWNGRRTWLPPTMGQTEFQQRLSRAGPNEWKQAGGGAPYYMAPNGKLAPLDDGHYKGLGRYTLKSVSPGVYQPIAPDGGNLVDAHGHPWSFDVRKLGR